MPVFPSNPTIGDEYEYNDRVFRFNGKGWIRTSTPPSGSPGGGSTGGGVTVHGDLTGLSNDDHSIYALANGTRGNFQPVGSYATTQGLSDGLATKAPADATVNQSLASPANTGTVAQILSWMAGRLMAITGKTDWKTAPATTLEAAKTHIDATGNVHNVTPAQIGASASGHNHAGVYQPVGSYLTAHRAIPIPFVFGGALVDESRTPYLDVNGSYTVTRIKARLVVAADANVVAQLYKRSSGTDTLLDSISIPAGSYSNSKGSLSYSVVDGDALWVKLDNVGSSAPGENYSLMVELT